MTKNELKKFQDVLRTRRNELEGMIRNREAAAIESRADALDQIQHMVERELALEWLGRESALLRQTRDALRRVEAGTFGICLDCEEDISPGRLAAVPWAARCVACQERLDSEEAKPADAPETLPFEAAA